MEETPIVKFICEILELAKINIAFTIVSCVDLGVDILLAFLDYFNGDYTKMQLISQLGNKISKFAIDKINIFSFSDKLNKKIEKAFEITIMKPILDELEDKSNSALDLAAESIIDRFMPAVSE